MTWGFRGRWRTSELAPIRTKSCVFWRRLFHWSSCATVEDTCNYFRHRRAALCIHVPQLPPPPPKAVKIRHCPAPCLDSDMLPYAVWRSCPKSREKKEREKVENAREHEVRLRYAQLHPRLRPDPKRLSVSTVSVIFFGPPFPSAQPLCPLEFLCIRFRTVRNRFRLSG